MNKAILRILGTGAVVAVGLAAFVGDSWSARESNVRATKHNLSKDWYGGGADPRTVKATSETQVCVFCHTPHAATPAVTPLWNKQVSGATYTTYTSSSLDAQAIAGTLAQPGGSSKLCLSCHDGTLAIGNVNVLNGAGSTGTQGTQSIALSGTGGGGTMAPGSGTTTGFTRFLGTDLSNDHPISVTYNKLLSDRDGEIRDATLNATDGTWEWVNAGTRIIGVRSHRTQGGSGQPQKPVLPLEKTGSDTDAGQVQCASCHDPHIRETDTTKGNQKFLRLNRFQESAPANAYSQDGDIICLACHNKNRGSGAWAYSAHANPLVATQTYTSAAATQREFPANMQVWKAACLNCHDTHSVPGSRRLLREGTDGVGTPKSGGSSAIEETCYQCHTNSAASAITPTTTVPDIKTDFTTSTVRMPISSTNQPAGTEVHDIGGSFNDATFVDCTGTTNKCGKDFLESRAKLGAGNLSNRHAECTDCHNPHRVVKFRDFRGLAGSGNLNGTPDAAGTHTHTETTGYTHTNIASGVLRGTWGVEPTYGSASFHSLPSGYVVKRGDPGSATDTSAAATYVTREYQVCLKCHSDYGYSDNNTYPTGNRPNLGSFTGGTPSGRNGLTQYTNQAKEFQAPAAHKGASTQTDSGAGASYTTNNQRSWHPVMDNTGRTLAVRGGMSNSWRLPWSNAVGTQTMYCSDCHGSSTAATSVIPAGGENGSPWGPHGSANDFLLKGAWTDATSETANLLCFKCHDSTAYIGGETNTQNTGFWQSSKGNLHRYHDARIGRSYFRCTWCHIAVPHGWKNKALLVNLSDVGPEAGLTAGTAIADSVAINGYSKEPYYYKAVNKIKTFKTSGSWAIGDCGNGDSDKWMRSNPDASRGEGICKNPP
ncbi:cytochrome c3 family protein [Azospira restricta]|uniref:Doubled CXXCH motif domain-containing protein n=1 Tax=Azospira restricta TaxID=404405 RepID=A0A974PVS6_9RHOO|nr:cytochrome c3 family protein [Azospira restricta]QRJ62417.1 hypothetical protein IWH25_11535 [Azospira restricta]